MAQQLIADNEFDLAAARALLWQTSWLVTECENGTEASSRSKVFVSDAASRGRGPIGAAMRRAGPSEEFVVVRIYADIRAFRMYDGASEVHRMSIAKRGARRARS
jgi:acyl-CoA dehydrogenase